MNIPLELPFQPPRYSFDSSLQLLLHVAQTTYFLIASITDYWGRYSFPKITIIAHFELHNQFLYPAVFPGQLESLIL